MPIVLIVIILIIILIITKNIQISFNFSKTKEEPNNYKEKNIKPTYKKKDFLTNNELDFYKKFQELDTYFNIIPQVNLAAVIKKETLNKYKKHYQSELYRNIDFGIFTKEFDLLLLIELNDSSHNEPERKRRDKKVESILNESNIKLIRFYTNKPNEKDYIVNRIIKTIKDCYPEIDFINNNKNN